MIERARHLHGQFRVAVRAREGGRYTYQIFTVAGEPRTFRSDSKSYATPDEAERAGYEAVAVLKGSPQ
jgi:predicted ATPase